MMCGLTPLLVRSFFIFMLFINYNFDRCSASSLDAAHVVGFQTLMPFVSVLLQSNVDVTCVSTSAYNAS